MRIAAVVALSMAVSAYAAEPVTRAQYRMGTVCEIRATAADATIEAAFDEAARIESMLSTWRDDSELARFNATAGARAVRLSPELTSLLTTASDWGRATNAAFDPLVGRLVTAWQIRGEGRIPTDAERDLARRSASLQNLEIDGATARLRDGAQVEEGGFGKGYALGRMLDVLRSRGAADAVINFGGQIAAMGSAPVDALIADPSRRDRPALALTFASASLSTSSGSEKSFVSGDRHFSHIVDPRSGEALPPRGSTSVLHEDPLVADILSTALYVMGPDEGLAWAESHHIAALFVIPSDPPGQRWSVRTSSAFRASARGLRSLDRNFTLENER